MPQHHLDLDIIEERLAVCRLAPDATVPEWVSDEPSTGALTSITRTRNELSIVCSQAAVPANVNAEKDWRAIRVRGTLDFSDIGIMASLVDPLADIGVSVFTLSTFDTDYVLLKETELHRAALALVSAGHRIQHDFPEAQRENGEIEVRIAPLTETNWREALALRVNPDQKNFVANNAYSIAQSRFHPDWSPEGVFVGNVMVGFSLMEPEPKKRRIWIVRYMIAGIYQGRGYGKAGLLTLIKRFRTDPTCDAVFLSIDPDNENATKVYESVGFVKTGDFDDGEVVMRLQLTR